MEWLTEPFSFDFMQRAVVGGVLAVIATSVVGTWVVLRGLAFMGDALAHGIVPGVAIALLLDVNVVVGAAAAAVVMIGAISLIHRTTRLTEDTAIGLLFVGMLALGVVIVSRARSFAVDVVGVLFGDVLGVTTADLWVSLVATLVVIAGVVVFYRPLLALSFDEDKAATLGMRPRLAHLVMLGLITLSVVTSFQTVGALLVLALLVAPPATAILVARRVPAVMVFAALIGSAEVATGLLLSYHLDTAGGATIALLAVVVFFVVLAGRKAGDRIRAPRLAD